MKKFNPHGTRAADPLGAFKPIHAKPAKNHKVFTPHGHFTVEQYHLHRSGFVGIRHHKTKDKAMAHANKIGHSRVTDHQGNVIHKAD